MVRDISERKRVEAELQKTHAGLKAMHDAMVGRELRMIALKKEVNELLERAGLPHRYPAGLPEKKFG